MGWGTKAIRRLSLDPLHCFLPPIGGPWGTSVTSGPNKGPSELLSASGRRERSGAGRPRWTHEVLRPAAPLRVRRARCPRENHRGGIARAARRSGEPFYRLRASRPARPDPAPLGLARAPPKCGLPNKSWNSRLVLDKEGRQQIDAAGKPYPSRSSHARLGSPRRLIIHPTQAVPATVSSRKKKRKHTSLLFLPEAALLPVLLPSPLGPCSTLANWTPAVQQPFLLTTKWKATPLVATRSSHSRSGAQNLFRKAPTCSSPTRCPLHLTPRRERNCN